MRARTDDNGFDGGRFGAAAGATVAALILLGMVLLVAMSNRARDAALERERAVLTEQARASGKPDAIIEKMVEGRVRKYYEEVVLLEQVWVHDGESRVRAVVKKAGAKLGGFARFTLGEGIEKQVTDFAAEVAATAKTSPPEPKTPPDEPQPTA